MQNKNKTTVPPYLKKGSHVRILATARKIDREAVEPAINLLESWGLRVSLGAHLFDIADQFAGTAENRLEDLQTALDDESVDMVWCARGGYGTVKLLDKLNLNSFREKPKWVAGYSDVTALLLHLYTHCNISTLHCTMPINISHDDLENKSIMCLKHFVFGNSMSYPLSSHPLNIPGTCKGELYGGNLSMLNSLLGSNTINASQLSKKILFLEDLDEYLYHIDRMMMNLERNGILDELSGVLVGGMTDMNDNAVPFGKSAEEIIIDYFTDRNIPVFFNAPLGHKGDNLPLPIGKKVEIKNNKLYVL
ncbi:MAG: muramoyltetrapeptide carboxypeptidase [Bacteroidia bacterium]|jgi:muramoyltetrapeptide carboxypeptidase